MTVGSALGFTDTAHSSIMGGLGSGAGAGLEFCYKVFKKNKECGVNIIPGKQKLSRYKGKGAAAQKIKDFQYVFSTLLHSTQYGTGFPCA